MQDTRRQTIIPEGGRNVEVTHSYRFLLFEKEADVAGIHLLFLTAPSPFLTFSMLTGEVAEIAVTMTSLWEESAGQTA